MKRVVHYRQGIYLPVTTNWIYSQIKNLETYEPIVYALRTENLDVFPTTTIRSLNIFEKASSRVIFNKIWNKIFLFYPFFEYWLKIDKPNVVHAHFGPAGFGFLKLKKKYKFPLITSFYGYDLTRLPKEKNIWREKYIRLFEKGEGFLVEGNHMKKMLVCLGCPENKIIVNHLGVDMDRIKFATRRLDKNEVRILIAGSFIEKKGIPYAIEACGIAKKTLPQLKFKITMIGDAPNTDEGKREKLRILEMIKKHELENNLVFLGYQSHSVFIEELYKNHIFLSPSVHASNGDIEGGLPVAIIEAAASGMIILSTNHCDIPEAVTNGGGGFLVPERNSLILAEKLKYLIEHPDSWSTMGSRGRKHIDEHFNVKTQIQKLEDIYDKFTEY